MASKEQRKIKARREQGRSIWYGLGMFGLVGWSIAVPTLVGISIGVWVDRTWQHEFSCTLMCLFIGVVIGCSIAWYWVSRESWAAMGSDNDDVTEEMDDSSRGGRA